MTLATLPGAGASLRRLAKSFAPAASRSPKLLAMDGIRMLWSRRRAAFYR